MLNFFVNLFLTIMYGYNCFPLTHIQGYGEYIEYGGNFAKYFRLLGNMFNNSTENSISFGSTVLGYIENGAFVSRISFNSLYFDIAYILGIFCCIWIFIFLVRSLAFLFKLIPNALTGRI